MDNKFYEQNEQNKLLKTSQPNQLNDNQNRSSNPAIWQVFSMEEHESINIQYDFLFFLK